MTELKEPKALGRLKKLAEEHGWEHGVEDSGDYLTFFCSRWVGSTNNEFLFIVEWEENGRTKKWRCVERYGVVRLNLIDESHTIIDTDDGERRNWKALSHIEHWMARPDEVESWDWVKAEAGSR